MFLRNHCHEKVFCHGGGRVVVRRKHAMAGKTKAARMVVKLLSTAGTGFFYITSRKRALPNKLQLMKYDPVVNRHVLFNEAKK